MSVAEELGEFLSGTSAAHLPAQAMEYGAMLVASTVASAAAGTTIDSARIIRALARERGGRPDASLWFAPETKLPVAHAAQGNALASDAAASDDSDLRNIVHSGTPASTAAVALAEREGLGGEAVMTAIVLGYETAGRISAAMSPNFRDRGFHGCHGAVFASAVATGHLLALDGETMAQAIALAATSIGGLIVAADTSTAREYHGGLATLLGINAALAAERGYQTETKVLEAKRGFFEALGGVDGSTAGASATADLGESWDIVTDMAIKLAPGAHANHSIAEAAALAASDGGVVAEEVETISVSRPKMTALTGPRHPTDLVSMAHSSAYFAAAGVADRDFTWVHASAEKIADPVIHQLIDRVEVGELPVGTEASRYRQGATVTIATRDGRTTTRTVYMPKGAGALGIAWSDVDAKYRALLPASGLDQSRIEESLTAIHGLAALAQISTLTELLAVQ